MRRTIFAFASLSITLTVALAACSGKSSTPAATGTPLPCAVDAILEKSCRSCHAAQPLYGAPMAVSTYEDVQALSADGKTPIYQRIGARIHDDKAPMPQPPNPRLSADDTSVVDAWVAAGGPAKGPSDAACTPVGIDAGGDAADPNACIPDTHLQAQAAFDMPVATNDSYECYAFDYTPTEKRQAIRITPRVDNSKIVHHMLLFQASGPTKYTGTPQSCPAFGQLDWKMMYGWAPGGSAMTLPPEAGFPQEGTMHYVVQIHYNNVNHLTGQKDTSGFDLCTTNVLRPNDADVFAFGAPSFTIPAHGSLDLTCTHQVNGLLNGAHAIAALPHMHKLGTSISTTVTPKLSTTDVDLGTAKNFSFDAQAWVPVDHLLVTGDTVKTRCVWQNPTNVNVKQGENTEDEMCFSFTMYYPKKNLASFLQPTIASVCAPTP
jgi:cytochrome c551/c552